MRQRKTHEAIIQVAQALLAFAQHSFFVGNCNRRAKRSGRLTATSCSAPTKCRQPPRNNVDAVDAVSGTVFLFPAGICPKVRERMQLRPRSGEVARRGTALA